MILTDMHNRRLLKYSRGYMYAPLSLSLSMPLNYAKWEQIEVRLFTLSPLLTTVLLPLSLQLSDDSDFEGHPNVDKPSLVRSVFSSRN
jgi:hypothetical protein